ncbi:hypothetical protein [Flavobacterium capsici]|uniref:Uncharacterized protein n=1 Tax=Flavobacterium capsici TaxID=3075618 RepID=A0AA96J966_9FLAO|nr:MULTISPECIES: hypothetical protein [unclassified Flavobacterium]WNM20189.1 hypothetical protein RN608_05790 [Flavobacterium sp. PMR2A8]WNM21579.1 hypothetical protein RN605_12960 [Flavobacterium sp. PMTSA4]
MKKILLIFFLITYAGLNAQSISEINLKIGIPDTLCSQEIRIYKRYSITTSTEVFRLNKIDGKNWKAVLYHFRSDLPSFEKKEITPKNNFEYIWLQFYILNIDKLKSIKEIKYKLDKPLIVFDEKEGYLIKRTETAVTDGIGYYLLYKDHMRKNTITFDNYEAYLSKFPNVDELNSYNDIMSLIKLNFDIWK